MNRLYDNAIQSIQLGLEDYKSDDKKRQMSAVRNYYAGLLLLAKYVLTRAAPETDAMLLLSARVKPVPDGNDGVKFERDGEATIDFETIGRRFKDFDLHIDQSALRALSKYRNYIEHSFINEGPEQVREIIAKAFPVALDLFRLANVEPRAALGTTWDIMLEVQEVFQKELSACEETFSGIESPLGTLAEDSFSCPECGSRLVKQTESWNTDIASISAYCRACGADFDAERAVVQALKTRYEWDNYVAMTDGDDTALSECPECGNVAYIQYGEINGCEWCGMSLDECVGCGVRLTPQITSVNNSSFCDYCYHITSKDD